MPNSLQECCDSDTIGDILPPHYWSLEPWSHVFCCPRGMSPMSLMMVLMQLVTSASVSQVES